MSAPVSRWEFNLCLSGFGRTKKEAWDQVMDGVILGGLSCEFWDEARTDKEARRMRLGGEPHVVRCEQDEEEVPAGAMVVWEE
jgi:hypothetical protein